MKNVSFQKLRTLFFIALVYWSSSAVRAGELTDAVKADDLKRVQALISGGADVNESGLFGNPLHMAVAKGSVEIARVLIDAGADIEAEGSSGAHPLHTAALGNKTAVTALLIEHGANVDARDSKAMTPLIVSATFGYVKIAGALLEAGADPELEDDASHWRAIHHAAFNGHLEVTELLLSNGVNVNQPNPFRGEENFFGGSSKDHGIT